MCELAGLTLLSPLKPDMLTDFFASSILAEKVVCLPLDERQVRWKEPSCLLLCCATASVYTVVLRNMLCSHAS